MQTLYSYCNPYIKTQSHIVKSMYYKIILPAEVKQHFIFRYVNAIKETGLLPCIPYKVAFTLAVPQDLSEGLLTL